MTTKEESAQHYLKVLEKSRQEWIQRAEVASQKKRHIERLLRDEKLKCAELQSKLAQKNPELPVTASLEALIARNDKILDTLLRVKAVQEIMANSPLEAVRAYAVDL